MIADKIKNARTIKKLTQEQVAEDLNVSRQTISNWENGKSLPDIVSIIRMSELYDLSLDELLKGNATLLNKIERDMKVAKAENNVIKFAWISIVIGVVMIILGFPTCYVYAQNKSLEWERMKSRRYCEKMEVLFGVDCIEKLKEKIEKCVYDSQMRYSGGWGAAPAILSCIKVEDIGTLS